MTSNQSSNSFTPLTPIATTHPVLFIDKSAPLSELHACASERLHAILDYLTLMACTVPRDSAETDNSVGSKGNKALTGETLSHPNQAGYQAASRRTLISAPR